MTGLTDKPIFFLHLNRAPDANLVVKGEARGPRVPVSVKWGSKLMKNVNDSRVNVKVMTFLEFNIFSKVALDTFNPGTEQHRFASDGFHNYTWVKMPMVAYLSHAGEVAELTKGWPALEEIVMNFQDSIVWYGLGKVVAVDMFIGNYDRFSSEGNWINKGNVMFVRDPAGPLNVIGLDTYDPHSIWSDLRKPGHYDELRILTEPQRRNEFARACVRSVGQKLMDAFEKARIFSFMLPGQHRRFNFADLPNYFEPSMASFAAGIDAGADDLKRYLQARVARVPAPMAIGRHRKAIPQGILDRMAYLGW